MERPTAFNNALQETDIWLKQLREEMRTDSTVIAYAALRAVLHELRDRLMPPEAAHLSAQLPMLIRGLFFEGWRPGATPSHVRTTTQFLHGVRERAHGHTELDPNWATQCVLQLLNRHISPGEVNAILKVLPQELRNLWPSPQEIQRKESGQADQPSPQTATQNTSAMIEMASEKRIDDSFQEK